MSAVSFWEMPMLREKGRIEYADDVSLWRLEQLGQGLIEVPVDGEIGIRANELINSRAYRADRIIVATAMNGHQLVITDRPVRDQSGRLRCVDTAQ